MKKFLIGFSVCVGVILSVILIRNVRIEIAKDALRDSNVGDYVVFGAYEQDREVLNGKEDIEWLVLEKEEGRILVLSKYALDAQQYHTSKEDVTWETSTLRQWLNEDFVNSAFSGIEKSMIPTVMVSADKNPEYDTSQGNETQDKVFLLSMKDANEYFSLGKKMICTPTEYARGQGVYCDAFQEYLCGWWLRTSGGNQESASYVFGEIDGVHGYGLDVDYDACGVRPALWIDVN